MNVHTMLIAANVSVGLLVVVVFALLIWRVLASHKVPVENVVARIGAAAVPKVQDASRLEAAEAKRARRRLRNLREAGYRA